jgi:hypothetical protein
MDNQPINISSQSVSGKCDLKCAYNFKYPISNLTASNKGVIISLSHDNSHSPPVSYNNQKYIVSNILIMCPSIHTFNGSKTDAEIIIEHTAETSGPKLCVAIPFILSSETSTATNSIAEIIKMVSINAPAQGDSTTLNISNFTLQNIIPNKPFFSYTETNNTDWIVFGLLDAISLNTSTIETLNQILKPFPLPTMGGSLFLNASGPNTSGTHSDGIYISCRPTGSSEKQTPVEYSKNTPSYDFSNLSHNSTVIFIFQIIIGCILFILIFIGISYAYSFITENKIISNLPTM